MMKERRDFVNYLSKGEWGEALSTEEKRVEEEEEQNKNKNQQRKRKQRAKGGREEKKDETPT
jgi:hypothetical protein